MGYNGRNDNVVPWYAVPNPLYPLIERENQVSDVESALAEAMPDEELAALLDSPCAPPEWDFEDEKDVA